jgi:hypothetical protein
MLCYPAVGPNEPGPVGGLSEALLGCRKQGKYLLLIPPALAASGTGDRGPRTYPNVRRRDAWVHSDEKRAVQLN